MFQLSSSFTTNDVLRLLSQQEILENEINNKLNIDTFIFDDNNNMKINEKIELISIFRSLLSIDSTKRSSLSTVKLQIQNVLNNL